MSQIPVPNWCTVWEMILQNISGVSKAYHLPQLALIGYLTQLRLNREYSLNWIEEVPRSDLPVGMSMEDCLDCQSMQEGRIYNEQFDPLAGGSQLQEKLN